MPYKLIIDAVQQMAAAVEDAIHTGNVETLDKRLASVVAAIQAGAPSPLTTITKLDEEKQMVYGWALVTSEHGEQLIDLQDDVVDVDDLREAVHKFMDGPRTLGRMHHEMGVGEVVESIVFSADIQKALGIDLGREGWFVGVHVSDQKTWQLVKAGQLRMFSIGGSGQRTPMTKRVTRGSTVRLFAETFHA